MFTGFICNFILACFLFLLFFGLFVLFLFSQQGDWVGMWGLWFCFVLFWSRVAGWGKSYHLHSDLKVSL